MVFRIEFDTDNEAFGLLHDSATAAETARILGAVVEALNAGQTEGKCIDLNGNVVGSWSLYQSEM